MSFITTSVSGNTIEELEAYMMGIAEKADKSLADICELGVMSIDANLAGNGNISVTSEIKGEEATLTASCSNNSKGFNELLALEFGAGIVYNEGNANPYEDEFYMGVGSWNRLHPENAFNPDGWWYTDEDGERHHSYGTRATMPMAKTVEAIKRFGADMVRSAFNAD